MNRRKHLRSCATTYALAIATIAIATIGYAGPVVVLGKNEDKSRQIPVSKIDHSQWTALLRKYVDDRGLVDYAGWKASAPDVVALDNYLEHLSSADLSGAERNAALAFWINAYNAVTIKGILREYPTSSIRNHTAKFFGYNIWNSCNCRSKAAPTRSIKWNTKSYARWVSREFISRSCAL